MGRYLRVDLLGPGSRFIKKIIYRAAVSRILRNTGLNDSQSSIRQMIKARRLRWTEYMARIAEM